jgi:hypothetical protein
LTLNAIDFPDASLSAVEIVRPRRAFAQVRQMMHSLTSCRLKQSFATGGAAADVPRFAFRNSDLRLGA